MTKGQVISGEFGKILIRQKSDQKIELGELLVADTKDGKIILQVYDLIYGSQISQSNLELMSGIRLEENTKLELLEPELRNYNLALLKNLITIKNKNAPTNLPPGKPPFSYEPNVPLLVYRPRVHSAISAGIPMKRTTVM